MAIEIVDFPINSMVIFHSYVSLPEGTPWGNCHGGRKKSHEIVVSKSKLHSADSSSQFHLLMYALIGKCFMTAINQILDTSMHTYMKITYILYI